MTITITVGLGSFTVGETTFVLVAGIVIGMLLDRLGNRMKQREIDESNEGET